MRRILFAVSVVLITGACGDVAAPATTKPPSSEVPADAIVIRASTDLAVGQERLLLALATAGGARLGGPDLGASVSVFPEDEPSLRQDVAGTWIWAIPDVSGLYRFPVVFDRPGIWIAELTPGDGPPLAAVPLQVATAPSTPAIGAPAPASDTPVASDVADLSEITTDTDPDSRFYDLSVADAVRSGRPSVVVFATPRFCQTAICGPTLDSLKALPDAYPEANFVHVEVFDLAASPADATSVEQLVLQPAVAEWGLPSEPWVFVVDEEGLILGRFEGVVDPEEIEALLG